MNILRIFRQTGIWLIISLLFCSLSLKKDSFLNAELIRSKGKIIILRNNDVIVNTGNSEIWSIRNIPVSDISVFGNDIIILSGNKILIYSFDGRQRGNIELNDTYSAMERASTGYYLYSDIRGELVLYLLNSDIYSHITDINDVLGMQRDSDDNIIVHIPDGIYKISREGTISLLLDISCSSFAYDRNTLYIEVDRHIYQYRNSILKEIASYDNYKPFTVNNNILYLLDNDKVDSLILP